MLYKLKCKSITGEERTEIIRLEWDQYESLRNFIKTLPYGSIHITIEEWDN